jgi:hypothetical protein
MRKTLGNCTRWLLVPLAPEQAIHGGVGDLAVHDATFAEEPFLREPETLEQARRPPVPGIGVGFDAVQV